VASAIFTRVIQASGGLSEDLGFTAVWLAPSNEIASRGGADVDRGAACDAGDVDLAERGCLASGELTIAIARGGARRLAGFTGIDDAGEAFCGDGLACDDVACRVAGEKMKIGGIAVRIIIGTLRLDVPARHGILMTEYREEYRHGCEKVCHIDARGRHGTD